MFGVFVRGILDVGLRNRDPAGGWLATARNLANVALDTAVLFDDLKTAAQGYRDSVADDNTEISENHVVIIDIFRAGLRTREVGDWPQDLHDFIDAEEEEDDLVNEFNDAVNEFTPENSDDYE
ncbi:hypothetical protein H0H92_014955 [Tricholoma furcatifolium]|nr:hypothetical protein H0H92_014955 [Tricholoma furcatifolium]